MKPQILQDWDASAVATTFSKAANHYDSVARLQREVGTQLVGKLINSSLASQCVLDIGAGTGYCSGLLTSHCAHLIALDIAPAMLIQARHRLGENASYLAADTQVLPIKDHSVDIVFANLVLQWCVDLSAVFREFKRILKKDGQILFSTLGPKTLCELRDAWQTVDDHHHVNDFLDIKDIQLQLEQAGLSGIVEDQMMQLEYASAIHLMRELKTLGAVNISQSRQRGLTGKRRLQQVCDEYARLMGNQATHATWQVLFGQLHHTG